MMNKIFAVGVSLMVAFGAGSAFATDPHTPLNNYVTNNTTNNNQVLNYDRSVNLNYSPVLNLRDSNVVVTRQANFAPVVSVVNGAIIGVDRVRGVNSSLGATVVKNNNISATAIGNYAGVSITNSR